VEIGWVLRGIRDHLVGEKGVYQFEPTRTVDLPPINRVDLYLHIPFCRNLCPYCPYNRVRYDETLAAAYLAAVLTEIDLYHEQLGQIEIGSVYIGGGTPTTMLDELALILVHLRKRFSLKGDIAIETLPSDLDAKSLTKLKDMGISLLSIGVQSFDDRYLKLIGRNYPARILAPVISQAMNAGFDTVNLDLMFALPGQTTGEALADLQTAIALESDQVTLYPLFTFPYSAVGKHQAFHRVKFPGLRIRRRMYRALHDHALTKGYQRVSVWGFKRSVTSSFSSVTRRVYIGLGAGAGNCLPGMFYFNTFSVPAYIRSCEQGRMPVALKMGMTPTMEDYYWLYWRLYETSVSKQEFNQVFAKQAHILWLLQLASGIGMLTDTGNHYDLTERGAFWIHLLQNHYVLNYIDKVWRAAMQDPWPERITL
jgi:coproporphyrinogen III oxidase-like Fe-S oxidoreductase